jgi:hypothetical protein
MPLALRAAAALTAMLSAVPAAAQELGAERFFADTPEDEQDRQSTAFDGSLTSTTFYYRESGDDAPPVGMGAAAGVGAFSASPVDRIFTDLRAQLDAKHIAGSRADFRADVRGRLNTTTFTTESAVEGDTENEVPYQSGTLYGNEVDVRELYVRRTGTTFDVGVGRQYALELAATNFDGLKVERKGERWKLILFGGLYPSRISRDIRDDYPAADADVAMPGFQAGGSPILPVTGGVGTGYRFENAHGAIGAVGILPLADDATTQTAEEARVFGTANGYWRASGKVDFYHYLVVDAAGAGGARLTNLTLGINLQPTPRVRFYANVNRIDTETLNVVAQTKLQDPDDPENPLAGGLLQNNIEVQRIAQDSARVGLSGNFNNRVEVSTSGTLRRRDELRLEPFNGDPANADDDIVFGAAQAADITISLVDRKSLGGTRLGLSGTGSFGVGNVNLYRNRAYIGRLDVTKSFADDRAEFEGSLTYINSADDNRGTACNIGAPDMRTIDTCYGASEVQSVTAGLLLFYRFSRAWFVIANANAGPQMSKSADAMGALVDQPTILTAGLLLRLAYRF